jgi:hypothetical protein
MKPRCEHFAADSLTNLPLECSGFSQSFSTQDHEGDAGGSVLPKCFIRSLGVILTRSLLKVKVGNR